MNARRRAIALLALGVALVACTSTGALLTAGHSTGRSLASGTSDFRTAGPTSTWAPASAAPTQGPTETAAASAAATATLAESPTPAAKPTVRATATATASPVAAATPAACADATLARLTESQRIGQLFAYAIAGTSLSSSDVTAIDTYHFGSIWLQNNRTNGVAGVRTLADAVQALAATATGGVGFFVGADQEGGRIQRLAGPGFSTIPTALVQGTYSAALLQADAAQWGGQLAAAGVNLDFAPVMDVVPPGTDATNAPIGMLQREFGHDPATVATHGVAFLRGIASAGVATTLKHFPGLGRVVANTDYASGVVDTVTTMTDPYLGPFQAGIEAGAPFVMIALATYTRIDPGNLAVFSPTVMQTLLRGRLGFRGVIVSDSLSAVAVSGIDPGSRAVAFIGAGGDMIVINGAQAAGLMASALAARAAGDASFRAQVDAAARQVLLAKAAFGLLACG